MQQDIVGASALYPMMAMYRVIYATVQTSLTIFLCRYLFHFMTDAFPFAAFVDIADPAYDPAANAGISFEQVRHVTNSPYEQA